MKGSSLRATQVTQHLVFGQSFDSLSPLSTFGRIFRGCMVSTVVIEVT